MLEKPDLIDADALGQLDLFELAPNISTCVEFSRGVVVDQMASLTVSSSLYSTSACSGGRPHGPRRGWLRQSPHSACSMAMNGGVSAERKRHRPQDHVLEDGLVHFTLLISIPAKVTSFGFHPDGRKLLSGNSIRPSWDGTSQKLPPSQCNSASHSFYEVAAAHGLDHAVMNAALE
jgi:hypothetical protein